MNSICKGLRLFSKRTLRRRVGVSCNEWRPFSGGYLVPPQHIDTPDNTLDTEFDFSEEEYKEINALLTKYPSNYKQSATIPLLYIAQKHCEVYILFVDFLSCIHFFLFPFIGG